MSYTATDKLKAEELLEKTLRESTAKKNRARDGRRT